MKTDKRVYTYVEYLLEHYHDNEKIDLRRKYLIAEAKNAKKPTEEAVLNILSDAYLCNVALVHHVIGSVLEKLSDTDLRLIDLIYFKQSHTVTGAGMEIGLQPTSAYKHRNQIIKSIATELGYIMEE